MIGKCLYEHIWLNYFLFEWTSPSLVYLFPILSRTLLACNATFSSLKWKFRYLTLLRKRGTRIWIYTCMCIWFVTTSLYHGVFSAYRIPLKQECGGCQTCCFSSFWHLCQLNLLILRIGDCFICFPTYSLCAYLTCTYWEKVVCLIIWWLNQPVVLQIQEISHLIL